MTHETYVLGLRFNIKIHISFLGGNSRTVALRQIKLGTMNDQDILFELLFCLTKVLNLWVVRNFEVTLRKTVYYRV